MGALETLKETMERRASARAKPKPSPRPRLLEIILQRERPLCLLVRGIVGLADHKIELTHYKQKEPKPLGQDEKPDYCS